MKKFLIAFFPCLIFGWIVLTIATDMVVIPTLFRTLKNVNLAGLVGINLFPKINMVEVVLGFCLLLTTLVQERKANWISRLQLVAAFFLFFLSLGYRFYLSPEIRDITLQIQGLQSPLKSMIDLSLEHHFFHQLYIRLDIVKLVILMMLFGIWSFGVVKNQEEKL